MPQKMTKKLVLILFSIFLIFINSCNQISFGQSSSKPKDINIYVGIEGLKAEFIKNAPPQQVFENSNFPIMLKINNNGAYSITEAPKGFMSLGTTDIAKPSFQPNIQASAEKDNAVSFVVDGKTTINPKGGEIILLFDTKTGKLDESSQSKPSTISATLCYPYKTTLSTTVCIDPDIAGVRPGKKACSVKTLAFSGGQGAPISVTKIESQMIPNGDKVEPLFTIYIENRGSGKPLNIDSYSKFCFKDALTEQEKKTFYDTAIVKAYRSGDQTTNQLVCNRNIKGSSDKLTGFVKFTDKKDSITCSFTEGIDKNSDAYTSPLRIEIDYGYEQTISTNFVIQKPSKY